MLEAEFSAADKSHQMDLLPKFHPEFHNIENVWGVAKGYCRDHFEYYGIILTCFSLKSVLSLTFKHPDSQARYAVFCLFISHALNLALETLIYHSFMRVLKFSFVQSARGDWPSPLLVIALPSPLVGKA
jgi:hypothetical protein